VVLVLTFFIQFCAFRSVSTCCLSAIPGGLRSLVLNGVGVIRHLELLCLLLLLLLRFIKLNQIFVYEFLKCLVILAEKIHFHQVHQSKSLLGVALEHLQYYFTRLRSHWDVLLKFNWCLFNEFDSCFFVIRVKW
jgi:hypothetical protein